jgi:DNA-binding MarR family transcriptional regulator
VTGITDQLEAEGMVQRVPLEGDRRALLIRLTATGKKAFAEMASVHEGWIVGALAGLNAREVESLHALLGKVKQHINAAEAAL